MSARPGARWSAVATSTGTRSASLVRPRSGARGAHVLEDRLDPRGVLQRLVGTEVELRSDPQIEVMAEPVAYEASRALQRRHRGLPLRVVTEHEDEPRILQLALQQHRDLFLDELIDAVESLALHQRISTVVSSTMPSTWSSMKSMALDTTSLA